MGMELCFTSNSDFSNLSKEKLVMDDVLHKTFVEFDEKGTEAAAVTAVVMSRCMPHYSEMIVDRPFLFILRHNLIEQFLFIGKVETF